MAASAPGWLERAGVLVIVRLSRRELVVPTVLAAVEGGAMAVEVTLTTPGGLAAVTDLRSRMPATALIGVGSARTPDDVRRACDAGAQFVVTPTTDRRVIAAAVRREVDVVSGGFTPTEVDAAMTAGARYQKLFPASAVGPGYVRDLLAPLPGLRLVPTGGIRPEHIRAWRSAGAVAVAIGSSVVPPAPHPAEVRRATAGVKKAWEDAAGQ